MNAGSPPDDRQGCFVTVSELEVPLVGRDALAAAFADRLGAVDSWPGFRGLEVWADVAEPTSFVMVSWWDSPEAFAAYMGSPDHRASHRRTPSGPDRPRARRFRRFERVAT